MMQSTVSRLTHKVQALRRLLDQHGAPWVVAFLAQRYLARPLIPLFKGAARERIGEWLTGIDGRVHVYISPLDWHYPYQQRPQHIARGFAAKSQRVIFVTPAIGYDRTLSAYELLPGVMLTPHRDIAVEAVERPIVHVLSTDASIDNKLIDDVQRRGGLIVYDFIDALDDAVSSGKIGEPRRALHNKLISGDNPAAIIVSADVLLREVSRLRTKNLALITNGVDTAPFVAAKRSKENLRRDFAEVVNLGRPIIGYYGSFASWFDYDLLNQLARERPGHSIVAIGPDLDGTRHRLDTTLPNLFVLAAMPYSDLPRHAIWFDVCLVPFVINEITLATSPLKIFEYMALGKPTVSTDLPECRKYRSVTTAISSQGFLAAVDHAIARGTDPAFVRLAVSEGLENSWARKVDQMLRLIEEAETPELSSAGSVDPKPQPKISN